MGQWLGCRLVVVTDGMGLKIGFELQLNRLPIPCVSQGCISDDSEKITGSVGCCVGTGVRYAPSIHPAFRCPMMSVQITRKPKSYES